MKSNVVVFVCLGTVTLIPLVQGTGQPSAAASELRRVQGQTIFSKELPKADLTFSKNFQYAGSQDVTLYGNAEAEQYLFVHASKRGDVDRFYWVQFEHFLASNSRTYDYSSDRKTSIGPIEFMYDVKTWSNYASMQAEDPRSDGGAIVRLLTRHGLRFPENTVRVRMFHFPSAERRSELMIIYGEALARRSDVPVGPDGVSLDQKSPELALRFLEHAQRDMTITNK
ncbi:MAG: hypothetical protein WA324_00220 [Bryobacteraceae bacterium]